MTTERRARQALEEHQDELLSRPGVRAIGVGRGSDYGAEDSPCLVIFISASLDPSTLPSTLDGVPVFTRVSGEFTLH